MPGVGIIQFWNQRNRWTRRAVIASTALLALFAVFNWIVFPLPKQLLSRPSSTFVYSGDGRLLNCFTSSDRFWRKPVKLSQISPLMIKTVLLSEDRWFYWHPGFNPISLGEAALDNLRAGKIVRGGSTLTMQIARMIEPKDRTVGNKLIEIFRAVQLEVSYSKEELLEVYFNLAPYGGNIEGIGAASYLYFGKSPDQLSLSEIAILTALPNSPTQLRPDRDLPACAANREKVLVRMLHAGLIKRPEFAQALREEIPTSRVTPVVAAPHFCQYMAGLHPDQPEIHSTLDYSIQITCERLAANYQNILAAKGIHNLAVVVIDNKTDQLRAMIGSADFADTDHQGQVNGAVAPRSPGSALKPFVYALGFDRGIISPQLKVEDLPVNYSGYSPVNYDEKYHGVVSVFEALVQSLNVPAVNLTSKVGIQQLYDLLKNGGLSTLNRKPMQYGLPLILGSCEVTLLDLCNLYSALAQGGVSQPLRMLEGQKPGPPTRLVSPEAGWLVSDILTDLKRPDLPGSWEFTADIPKVAWKTGTSYGRKDAWAIGYDPDFTIGVWTGNFSAEGSIAIVGAETSAPLMFDIFSAIQPDGNDSWFKMPPGIDQRTVCATSGQVNTEACPDAINEYYIVGVSPSTRCTVHKSILVDTKTGYEVCRGCMVPGRCKEMTVEDWPPRLASWLAQSGIVNREPPHNPDCRGELAGDGPVIVSPERDAVYSLRASVPKQFQHILFKASLPLDSREAHWFVDGQLIASAPSDSSVFYLPDKGSHHILCVDSYGRSTSVNIRVQMKASCQH